MPDRVCANQSQGHVCTNECFALRRSWVPGSRKPQESFEDFLRSMFRKPADRRTPEEISRVVRAIVTPKTMAWLVRGTFVAPSLAPWQRVQLVHDTFTDLVINRFGEFNPERQELVQYVRGAVKNQTLRLLKPVREAPYDQAELEQIPDSVPSPEQSAIGKSNMKRLIWCAQKLPLRLRDVLRAADEGETAEQTATRLGIKVSYVRVLRHRARAGLTECLECGSDG